MKGQHISPIHQIGLGIGDQGGDFITGHEETVAIRQSRRVPEAAVRIVGGDLDAVEVADIAVVIFDLEGQRRDLRRVSDGERDADQRGVIHRVHRRLEVAPRTDQVAIAIHRVIAETRGPGLPRAVVIGDRIPPRRTGRHVCGGERHPGFSGGSGDDEVLGARQRGQAIGDVLHLLRVAGVGMLDGQAVGMDEREITAGVLAELEIGVELGDGELPVLAGGKDEQAPVRHHGHGGGGDGELPFAQVAGVIGEIPPIEADGAGAGIPNLQPVGVIPVLVHLGIGLILREKLGDIDGLRFRRAAKSEQERPGEAEKERSTRGSHGSRRVAWKCPCRNRYGPRRLAWKRRFRLAKSPRGGGEYEISGLAYRWVAHRISDDLSGAGSVVFVANSGVARYVCAAPTSSTPAEP